MAQSNSKLTKEQKAELKELKAYYGKRFGFGAAGRVTVVCKRISSDLVRFSTSVASRDEMKIRRKVGEWHALDRMESGEAVLASFPSSEWASLDDVAYNIAERLDW